MRFTGRLILFVIFALAVGACFNPPQFSIIPHISNPTHSFFDAQDSLSLTVHFTDGDGDDGLDPDGDGTGAYASRYFVTRSGTYVDPGKRLISSKYVLVNDLDEVFNIDDPDLGTHGQLHLDSLISYKEKYTHTLDTLPFFVAPYYCTRWEILIDTANNSASTDTVYLYLNPYNNNIFVDVLVQGLDPDNPTEFVKFDWGSAFPPEKCQPRGFDYRFPILASEVGKSAPLEGNITYGIKASWLAFWGNNVIELRVQICDRALHRSNIITTDPFTLR